jgi:hypothetical protein
MRYHIGGVIADLEAMCDKGDGVGNKVHVMLRTSTFRIPGETLLVGKSFEERHEVIRKDFNSLSRISVSSTDSRLHHKVLLNDVLEAFCLHFSALHWH